MRADVEVDLTAYDEYPSAARVDNAAGEALAPGPSAGHLYRFGLDVICDAVAAMIARKRGQ